MRKSFRFIFLFLLPVAFAYGQKYDGELSEVEYGIPIKKLDHLYQIAETKTTLQQLLEIDKGDKVAEIGSEDGVFLALISKWCDGVTFYAQDINPKALTEDKFKKTINSYSKYRKSPDSNTYKIIIGSEKESKLPDSTFDKIFIMSAFHDFDNKNEMLADVSKKLKPDGQLIIEDGFSFTNDTLICRKYGCHPFLIMDSLVAMCAKNNLYLVKIRNPNFHASHYANVLVFEKNKTKSEKFFCSKMAVDSVINLSFQLNIVDFASDSNKVNRLTLSTLPFIYQINNTYTEYNVWLKELALKYLRAKNYKAAINILEVNKAFYPNLYQTFYWLGVAYEETKQYALAFTCFNHALTINPNNTKAIERVKHIQKLLPAHN